MRKRVGRVMSYSYLKSLVAYGVVVGSLIPVYGAYAEDDGLVFELEYMSEVWTVASGGLQKGERYLDNLHIGLGKRWDQSGTEFYVSGLYNNGVGLTADLIGDAQAVSNIEAPVQAARLYEAWVEQSIGQTEITVKSGLLDVNADFDVLDSSGVFIGSAHGIGTDIAQAGENGPSIFPITALGMRVHIPLTDNWAFRSAVLDGVPGDPDDLKKTAIKLGGGDGAFLINELEYTTGTGKVLAGYWRYTADFTTHSGAVSDSNDGFYLRGEHKITGPKGSDDGLYVFGRIGFADAEINSFKAFYSAGVQYQGIFAPGHNDVLGFAIASAEVSEEYQNVTIEAPNREVAFEATYQIEVAPKVILQPDVQYIINPLEGNSDTLAIGLRAIISLY